MATLGSASPLLVDPATVEVGSTVHNDDEKLLFVFELVRHGARGPFDDHKIDEFPVADGQLTPEGMRQRYLLGRHSRERYTKEFPLLSDDGQYNPQDFFI